MKDYDYLGICGFILGAPMLNELYAGVLAVIFLSTSMFLQYQEIKRARRNK